MELKNDLAVRGVLHSVDQFLNIKLLNTTCENEERFPHLVSLFIYLFIRIFAPKSHLHYPIFHFCPVYQVWSHASGAGRVFKLAPA